MRLPFSFSLPTPLVNSWEGAQRNWEQIRRFMNESMGVTKLGDFDLIAGGTILDFSDIPQDYSHLRAEVVFQANAPGAAVGCMCRVNNSALPNYHESYYLNENSSGGALFSANNQQQWYCGEGPGSSRLNDNYVGHCTIDFAWYSRSDAIKTHHAVMRAQYSASFMRFVMVGGTYDANASPITRLTIFESGVNVLGPRARAILYGIR